MGRRPNAGGGRVAALHREINRGGQGRGNRRGGRGLANGSREASKSRASHETGGNIKGQSRPAPQANCVALCLESQRLIQDLLLNFHSRADGSKTEADINGAELVEALIAEERRLFEARSLTASAGTYSERVAAETSMRGRRDRVRISIAAWHHPDSSKPVVIERAPTLGSIFRAAKDNLSLRRPKAAFLHGTSFYLANTLTLEEDAVVVITSKEPPIGRNAASGRIEDAAQRRAEHAGRIDAVKVAYQARASERQSHFGRSVWSESGTAGSEETRARNLRLQNELNILERDPLYQQRLRERQGLPVWARKDEIIRLTETHQIIVLSGETGSGKTTQIASFLLDHLIRAGRGASASLLCTQPRRISATSCAERVAWERCGEVGKQVGYAIRLETRVCESTQLCFVTTGVVLRRLQDDPELAGVSHLLIDEVHERDLQTDFLLIIVKDLLRRRPDLRVVLMSATIKQTLFSAYFADCPTIAVPGRTFIVRQHYLEDIEQMLEGFSIHRSDCDRPRPQKGKGLKPTWPCVQAQSCMHGNGAVNGDTPGPPIISPKAEAPIDYPLILRLLQNLVSKFNEGLKEDSPHSWVGGILVFLPGFAEISELMKIIAAHPVLGARQLVQTFPLHSTLPPEAQRAVFQRPPTGVSKIICATNIAETSVTIDDIVAVIDAGIVKETRYDPQTHLSSLISVYISQACSQQRSGRAGRCREGDCYKLYTRAFLSENMPVHTLPEMLRTPLEELCLTIMSLELGNPSDFLVQTIEPPPATAVERSMATLRQIQAIRQDVDPESSLPSYHITPLGYHVANLPVDVRIGKMLIYGCLFNVIEPILTIAACLSYKTPFAFPFDKQKEADLAHACFASAGSDHLAALSAFDHWAELRSQHYHVRRAFCAEHFLSISTLEMLDQMRDQLRQSLKDIGFCAQTHTADTHTRTSNAPDYNVNVIKCVLTAGLYPNVAKLVRPKKQEEAAAFELKDKAKAVVHPGSVNFKRLAKVPPHGKDAYVLYNKAVQSAQVYLYDLTFVSPLCLILHAKTLQLEWQTQSSAERTEVHVVVDKWLRFRMYDAAAVLLKYLRHELNKVLARQMVEPSIDFCGTQKVLTIVTEVFASDRNLLPF